MPTCWFGTMQKPKLKDIALSAGVSLTTASMALSGKGRISAIVRERVLNTAKTLGYAKKKHAFSNQNENRRVGIFMQLDEEWAHVQYLIRTIVVSIQEGLSDKGYTTLLLPIHCRMENDEILRLIDSAGICALFSIHYGNEKLFDILEKSGLPVVLVNNNSFRNKFYAVCVDDFQGAYEGALYLLQNGHRAFAYLEYDRPDMPTLVANRFVGFKKALDEFHIEFFPKQRITIDINDFEGLRKALRTLFSGRNKPTALFVHDDRFAAHIVAILQTMGLGVPSDVSIIAPGDVLDYNEPFVPKITTMRINTALMGKLAMESMINRLCNSPVDVHVVNIKQQLIERGSCRKIGPAPSPGA
jgi:LacI family transcriptional regulator